MDVSVDAIKSYQAKVIEPRVPSNERETRSTEFGVAV
jgi:hypothetical protein